MSNDPPILSKDFYLAFLDDYFADCEEHITLARRRFAELEQSVGQSSLNPAVLDGLLRSFHTIKGLSGMVSLHQAEELTHLLESCLEQLRLNRSILSLPTLQTLEAALQLLEEVIAARRAEEPIPGIGPTCAQLANLLSLPGPSLPRTQAPPIDPAIHASGTGPLWQFVYTPSQALSTQGTTVETLRTQLAQLGKIISAIPKLTGDKGISFEFILASDGAEKDFAHLANSGLVWRLITPPGCQPPAVSSPAALTPPDRSLTPSNVVRVDLGRLDNLMQMVGDLVTSRARLEDQLAAIETKIPNGQWRNLQETNLALERHVRNLREGVMRVRLVPIGEAFERMKFTVRDLTRQSGREIQLTMTGQRTEIDKLVVERMLDPLLHLVRNAVSHGLESPAERIAAGKPPSSLLNLRANTSGDSIVIEIEDNGRGIDPEKIAQRARTLGLLGVDSPSGPALLDVLCATGFTTRDSADLASGRGIGLAVVKKTVLELGGSLTLESRPGHGCKFIIQLPLTLMIVDALIVTVGRETLAVPQPSLREVLQIDPSSLTLLENNEMIVNRGATLPVLRLNRFFSWPDSDRPTSHLLVVGEGPKAVGLLVDRIVGQREIVVRPITDSLIQVPGIAGATELSDGRVILILDPAGLTRAARQQGASLSAQPSALTGPLNLTYA